MNKNNDIYAISSRIKNIIARKNIALSPVGTILVNAYSLVLKDLYDFAEKYSSDSHMNELINLLRSKEDMPLYIIKLSTPKENKTLYQQLMEATPEFESKEEALGHYTKLYEELGGNERWLDAESSQFLNEQDREIMRIARCIHMCKYLIEKENV